MLRIFIKHAQICVSREHHNLHLNMQGGNYVVRNIANQYTSNFYV